MMQRGLCVGGVIRDGARDAVRCEGCATCAPDRFRIVGARWVRLICGHEELTDLDIPRCSACGVARPIEAYQPDLRAVQLDELAADYDARAKRAQAEIDRELAHVEAGGDEPYPAEWHAMQRALVERNQALAVRARARAEAARAEAQAIAAE